MDLDPRQSPAMVYWFKDLEQERSSRTHYTFDHKKTLCKVSLPGKNESGSRNRLCEHCKDKWVKMWYFGYTEEQYDRFQPLFCQMGGGTSQLRLTSREKHEFPVIAKELGLA